MGLLGLLSSVDYGMGGRLGKVIYLDSQNTVVEVLGNAQNFANVVTLTNQLRLMIY